MRLIVFGRGTRRFRRLGPAEPDLCQRRVFGLVAERRQHTPAGNDEPEWHRGGTSGSVGAARNIGSVRWQRSEYQHAIGCPRGSGMVAQSHVAYRVRVLRSGDDPVGFQRVVYRQSDSGSAVLQPSDRRRTLSSSPFQPRRKARFKSRSRAAFWGLASMPRKTCRASIVVPTASFAGISCMASVTCDWQKT